MYLKKHDFPWLTNNIALGFLMRLFDAKVVGGAVRNSLLQEFHHDFVFKLEEFDLATVYTPQQMQKIADLFKYKHIPTGFEHGTITILGRKLDKNYLEYCRKIDLSQLDFQVLNAQTAVDFLEQNLSDDQTLLDDEVYELTTLRIDKETDGRHAIVEYTSSWEEDAARRDFTINAMYVDYQGYVYDFFDGIADIQNKKIRFVGDPEKRIKEDYLRILRFFRFNAFYGEKPWSDNCVIACKNNIIDMKNLAKERLYKEWFKLLAGKNAIEVIKLMDDCGFFEKLSWPKPVFSALKPASPLCLMAFFQGDWAFLKLPNAHLKHINSLRKTVLESKEQWWQACYEESADWIKDKQVFDNISEDILAEYDNTRIFPVTGADIIQLGFSAGPEIGAMLAKAKKHWFETYMKADKEALLAYIKEN